MEIWQWHRIVDTYASDDINEVLEWYKDEWKDCYDNGNCAFYMFDNDKETSFEEEYKIGFF
jgi:hypothetical protein